MPKKPKLKLVIFIIIDVLLAAFCFWIIARQSVHFGNFAVLNPKGIIAAQERRLIIIATLIMLIGAIPVYFLIFFLAWKYRADKTTEAKYSPNLDSKIGAALIWLVPLTIISVIGVINWKSTHALDPYKPIASNLKPITIQVVALQWKWLFIYPEQNIASVNFIEFPVGAPVSFELTADAPMNSFWIPQLGGQMYAMAGMESHLNLMANTVGDFAGSDAEISGAGFASMRFVAKSASQADFDAWVRSVKASPNVLSLDAYNKLAEPSDNAPKTSYSSVEKDLYNSVMMKFMMPALSPDSTSTMTTHAMEGMQ